LTQISPPFRISIRIPTSIRSLIFHGTGCIRISRMSLSPARHVRQTLQHTATLGTTLQHTATHCNISWLPPHHRCNTLQHTHSNDYLLVVNETHGIMRVVGTPVLLCTSVCVCMTLRENTRERERTRVG